MAYGVKYRMEWADRTGAHRVHIEKEAYAGSVLALAPAAAPLVVVTGQQDAGALDLTSPVRISRATLRFFGDASGSLVDEIVDGADTEYRVRHYVDRTARDGTAFALEWTGYADAAGYQDHSEKDSDIVELRAIDGLAFLQDRVWSDHTGEEQLQETVLYILETILAPIAAIPMVVEYDWHTYSVDVPAGENLLQHLFIGSTAYGGVASDEDPWTLRDMLDDVLEQCGLILFQDRGRWVLRQRSAIGADGTVMRWTADLAGWAPGTRVDLGTGVEVDVNAAVPVQEDASFNHTRLPRLRSVESVHDFGDIENAFFNDGFESGIDGWTTGGALGGGNDIYAQNYDQTSVDQNSTQDNLRVLVMSNQDTTTDVGAISISQESTFDVRSGFGGLLEFSADVGKNVSASPEDFLFQIRMGSYALLSDALEVTSFAEASGDDPGLINIQSAYDTVSPAEVLAPAGATLLVVDPTSDGANSNYPAPVTTIELAKDINTGDSTVEATFSDDIPSGSDILYYRWETYDPNGISTIEENRLPARPGVQTMEEVAFTLPLHTPQGVDVSGTLRFEMTVVAPFTTNIYYLDNVQARFSDGEDEVGALSYIAIDPRYGEDLKITHRAGDGPTQEHPRALDPGLSASDPVTDGWKEGAYGNGEASTDVGLEELIATTTLRYQRAGLDRYTYPVVVQSGVDLSASAVYDLDGRLFTVSYLQVQYGADRATIELTELRDAGLQGTSGAYGIASGGENGPASGGGSSPTFIGTQSISGATSWAELSGRPQNIFSRDGATDGIAETIPIASSDVTGALGYTPYEEGTDLTANAITLENLEFDTAPQGNGTLLYDQSTGLAVRYDAGTLAPDEYTGYATLLDSVNTITGPNLSLTGGTVTDVRPNLSIVQGPGSGLDADTLDGYEADALAALAEDETVSGAWTFQRKLTFTEERDHVQFDNAGDDVYWQNKPAGGVEFGVYNATRTRWSVLVKDDASVRVPGKMIVGADTGPFNDADLTVRAGGSWGLVVKGSSNNLLRVADDNGSTRLSVSNGGLTQVGGSMQIDAGRYSSITILSDDDGESVLNLRGNSQGTGRLFVGQDGGYGGGIEYNGDGTPTSTGAGSDYVTLFRRDAGTDEWTARSRYDSDDWEFRGDILFGGQVRSPGAVPGFTGTGTIIDASESWFDNIKVRGSLLAYEFEARKITVSRGPLAVSPGGGKIETVAALGGSDYRLYFAEAPGLAVGDLLLIKEIDTSGASVAIAKEVFMRVTAVSGDGKTVTVYTGSGSSGVPYGGDDVAVVGSNDTDRDSLLYLDPYVPALDILDGIANSSDWQSRTPQVRLGDLDGMPSFQGQTPEGHSLWADNAYLRNVVASGTIYATAGEISDSVVVGGKQARDLASVADTFSGDYSDLSGQPVLGAVAALDTIDGAVYIQNGTVVADLLAADVGLFSQVFSTNARVDERLEVGSSIALAASGHDAGLGDEIRVSADGSGTGGANFAAMYYDTSDNWGVRGVKDNATIFQLGSTNKIGAWTFDDDALYAVDAGVYTSLSAGSDDHLPWSTNVNGLQVGTDINNRMWFGRIGSDYDMRMVKGGDDLVRLGSSENQIAGWDITSSRLEKTGLSNSGDVVLGEWTTGIYGIRADSNSGQIRLWMNGGEPELLAYIDNSNFISIGSGFNRSVMGMTVRAGGDTVLKTTTTGAEMGHLSVSGPITATQGQNSMSIEPGFPRLELKNNGHSVVILTAEDDPSVNVSKTDAVTFFGGGGVTSSTESTSGTGRWCEGTVTVRNNDDFNQSVDVTFENEDSFQQHSISIGPLAPGTEGTASFSYDTKGATQITVSVTTSESELRSATLDAYQPVVVFGRTGFKVYRYPGKSADLLNDLNWT